MKSQLSLFESTDCHWICYAPEYASKVQPWLDARPMKSNAIDAIKDIIHEEQVPLFPYDRPYDKAINEPAMVLHTSGSTGIPKPIICRHGMLTVMDAYHRIPEFSGFPCFLKAFSDRTTKVLCASMLRLISPKMMNPAVVP
jgi:acyl-CoA synthetase (AMP-forming)/AMP-acid ligase II